MSDRRLAEADFYIVTVPTPIDSARRPDLGAMLAASDTVGGVLKRGDIVVYESTVYPGAIEEDCVPVLEKNVRPRRRAAISPSAIRPSASIRATSSIASRPSSRWSRRRTRATLDIVADVYGSVVTAGIHRAPSIKVAEAAKVIENTQRDLNIAFMNELSAIFHQLGIDTGDVLAAAATKWNFLQFQPGLVGGHCIGVDPYYLTFRAEKAGYHPEVILAGRRINDGMGERVARECVRALAAARLRQRDRHRARPDLQGERAGHPQLQGRRYRARAGAASASTCRCTIRWRCRRDRARIRHHADADRSAEAGRRRHPRGRA